MTHHTWTDRLSEYIDGELDAGTARALELHLAGCADCRAVADDLRTVSARGRALPELPATGDLWPGIASRMQAADVKPLRPRAVGGLFMSWPRLAAAGLLLGLASGGAVYAAIHLAARTTAVAAAPIVAVPGSPMTVPTETHASHQVTALTARAVADLEMILASEKLDSGTVRVLTVNLARIDSAIADAERALAADPSNVYVSRHLASTARRKVELLHLVAGLTQSRS
jgi:anti-sigma factor RsiW